MFKTVLVILLVVGCVTVAFAESKKSAATPGYQAKLVYEGPYRAERLYQLNVYQET
jgi:hypothetical protein